MTGSTTSVDWKRVRDDFPILRREIDGAPIVYLDSGNTSQKPHAVIEAMDTFQRTSYAPINRSAYRLAAEATDRYEQARAASPDSSTRRAPTTSSSPRTPPKRSTSSPRHGAARTCARATSCCSRTWSTTPTSCPGTCSPRRRGSSCAGCRSRADGQLDLTDLDRLLDGASAFGFTAMSNVLGTLNPVAKLVAAAHDAGATTIVDACQYVPHNVTDVQAWGADFVAFSSHKMCGPSGIGALWGRTELLDAMPPYIGGGNMIADVRLDGFTCAPVPAKFEAGTPPITEAIGFGAAVEYLESIGMAEVRRHEMELTRYAIDTLNDRYGDDITIHGPDNVEVRGGVLSFAFRGIHPHDLSQVLDQRNVCVRAGHHCAKPLMRILGVNATARASLYLYNDQSDVDALADALDGATDIFGF